MRRFLIAGSLVLGMSFSPAGADTIHVPGDYPTIQAGIDATENGDEVVVADGVYTGPGNRDLDFVGKRITVRSENGSGNCIIDCEGTHIDRHRGFYFHSGETQAATVEGFTITGGYAPLSGVNDYGYYGGGILCDESSPTLRNCTIRDNVVGASGWAGGGMYLNYCSAHIIKCTITHNTVPSYGGGIACWGGDPTITNCTISDNTAGLGGGGISLSSGSMMITNSILWGNTCREGEGLEVSVSSHSALTIDYSDVAGGRAEVPVGYNST